MQSSPQGLRERAFVPVLVFVGLVVAIISSLGAPLIPSIADKLGTSLSSAQWSLTATLLTGAVASPLIGRLGDGRQRRRVILLCLGSVALGGVLAALAGSLGLLVLGRALQGLGLALVPLTMAAARDALSDVEGPRVIALLSIVTAVGVGLGYPITGLIASALNLEAAFWFGAVIAAVALLLALLAIPQPSAATAAPRRLDLLGALLVAVALICLLIGVEKGPDWGWGSRDTLGLIALSLVFFALWARRELATPDPLVDLRLTRHRAVLTANLGGGLLGVALYMELALMTQFVQLPHAAGFGFAASVFVAGLTLTPMSITSFTASRFLPPLEARLGARRILTLGALMVGAGALFFAVTADALWQAFAMMAITGVGFGWTYAALPGLIVRAVPRSETGSAMGFYQVSRYIGFSIGSGLSVTLLRGFSGGAEATLGGYRAVYVVAAAVCVATALLTWALPGRQRELAAPAERAALERLEVEEGALASAGLGMDE